jgi:uncharacterized coiled-coil protein SlyX
MEKAMSKDSRSDRERIVDAEVALTHLQHDYETLNEVVLQQQKTIEQLSLQVKRLQTKVETNTDPEIRDAEAERPPHY